MQYGLTWLEQEGFVVEATEEGAHELAAFRDALNLTPAVFEDRLENTPVAVRSFGMAAEPFVTLLRSLHLRVADDGAVGVVLVDDYLRDELDDVERAARAQRQPWLLVKPVGTTAWIGPVFYPDGPVCWHCLRHRLRQNRRWARDVTDVSKDGLPGPAPRSLTLPSVRQTALAMAATTALRLVADPSEHDLHGVLLAIDAGSPGTTQHVVTPRDGCPQCWPNEGQGRSAGPLEIRSRPNAAGSDDDHDSTRADATFRRYAHLISPVSGVVRTVASMDPGGSDLVHAYVAEHVFLPTAETNATPVGVLRRSGGRGMSDAQAKTSALCEALEHSSGAFHGNEERVSASYLSLGERAIHPNSLMNFSDRQYAERDQWNARGPAYHWVPAPFDERQEIDWTSVWSMTDARSKYVPTAYCYYGCPLSADAEFCKADSRKAKAADIVMAETIP